MTAIFFILSVACGIALAAVCAKLFVNAKRVIPFFGIRLASPRPAIIGLVLGVVVLASSFIVFLGLSSSVAGLRSELKRTGGSLSRVQKNLDVAKKDITELESEVEGKKGKLAQAEKQIGKLRKEIEAKEETRAEDSTTVDRYKEEVSSVRQKLAEKTKEADTNATNLGIAQGRIEALTHEVEQMKRDLEEEKHFRRNFQAFVEEQEAIKSSFKGNALKLYQKLIDLRNKYK